MTEYLLADDAERRLHALARVFDPWTFRHLEALGLTPGWRCWEVGAGGASVPQWLGERVGATGRVLATDLDIAWARRASAPNVEVRVHDIGKDSPPGELFDLIHARLVLVHVRERERALRLMVDALVPGGWLVLEDADPALQPLLCLEEVTEDQVRANRLRREFRTLLAERGADLAYGRKLPRLMREAGLSDVASDAYFAIAVPGLAELERRTIDQIRAPLLASGRATAEDLDLHLAAIDRLDPATSPLITAWGRKR